MKQINTMRAILSLLVVAVTCLTAKGQLNGTYTVYGAGANYADLTAAANALSAGVSGPVTFKIRPGTWTSSSTSDAVIGNIAGASATNTITFEAENGSAATTIVQNTNTSSSTTSSNFIFYLNGAKYVRVRNLTLDKTHATYGNCVRFAGDADYNIIENCVLTGDASTSTNTGKSRIYGTSLVSANNNIIRNNTINNGSYGIYWRGSSTSSLSADNEISGNTLNEPYNYGIYSYYTSDHKVLNNTISRAANGGNSFYGIYQYYGDNAFKIDGNTITTSNVSTTTHYPIYMYYSDGASNDRGGINNNIISVSSSTTCYGIYSYYSNYYDVANNKVTLNSSGACYTLYANNGNSSTYGKSTYITGNEFTSTSNSSHYVYNYGYYLDNGRFNNNKITFNGGSGSQYIYAGYHYTYGGREFNGNTIRMYGTSCSQEIVAAYQYTYGGLKFNNNDIEMVGTTSGSRYIRAGEAYLYDGLEFNNNKIKIGGTSGTKYINVGYQYCEGGLSFSDNEIEITTTSGTIYNNILYYSIYNTDPINIKNNKMDIQASSSASVTNYLGYYNPNSSAAHNEVRNNEITIETQGYVQNFMGRSYNGCNISDNTVHAEGGSFAYAMYSDGYSTGTLPSIIKNNKVTAISNTSTAQGMVISNHPYAVIANNVVYARGSFVYGMQAGYNNGGAEYYNNTVYTDGSSTQYTFYCYQTSPGQFANIRNNVFARNGGSGYLMLLYNPSFY